MNGLGTHELPEAVQQHSPGSLRAEIYSLGIHPAVSASSAQSLFMKRVAAGMILIRDNPEANHNRTR